MDSYMNTLLEEIRVAIAEIETFFPRGNLIEHCVQDPEIRLVIGKNVELIRERTNHLLKVEPEIPISDIWKSLVSKNLTRTCGEILTEVAIWTLLVIHLPVIKSDIGRLIPA